MTDKEIVSGGNERGKDLKTSYSLKASSCKTQAH